MKKEDIKLGMEIIINNYHFRDKTFPIIEIKNDNAIIKGYFNSDLPEQTIEIPLSELIEGSFEKKTFLIKDYPKWDETILVSNKGVSWFIRSFHSFSDEVGCINTILCAADTDVKYDDKGCTIGEYVKWNKFKRVEFKD